MKTNLYLLVLMLSSLFPTIGKAVIFSKTQSYYSEWVDPRTEMKYQLDAKASPLKEEEKDKIENSIIPQLQGIGVINNRITLIKPPPDATEEMIKKHQAGPVTYEGQGTGFMINECLMVTAAHVLTGKSKAENVLRDDKGNVYVQTEVYLRNINKSGMSVAKKLSAQVVALSDYSPEDNSNAGDIGVIKIKDYSASPDQIINWTWQVENKQAAFNSLHDRIHVAGYFDDKMKKDDTRIFGEFGCFIYAVEEASGGSRWKTGCASQPGSSGSPIFGMNPKTKRINAIGLMTNSKIVPNNQAVAPTEYIYNLMIPFSAPAAKDFLLKAIEDNPCQH